MTVQADGNLHWGHMSIDMFSDVAAQLTGTMPALVAQLDVHPTGDQEVMGSVPTGSSNILL